MLEWKGKTRGGIAGYKIFIAVLKYLGLPVAYFILRFIIVYFVFFSPKGTISIYSYFRHIHRQSVFTSIINIFRNFYLLGQVLLDKISVLAGFNNNFTFDFEGEEHLREMVAQGKGGVLIGAHVGNWEVAGQLLERLDTRINIVMLDAEHRSIKEMLDEVMVKKNMNVIAIKDDFSHLFQIKEALQNNELVAIHGDRFIPGTKTISCSFLGKQALFPTGALYLASKYKSPVSFVAAMKDTKTHYHFYASKPKMYPYPSNLKIRNSEQKAMVEDYVTELEKTVLKYPLQWFNYYYFWEDQIKAKT
ncbi:MAG: acyltransferase [Bacteroidales bacterium]|nr:acyltransferase [Bacteroidales bacterium]MCF8458658.1 acyltransferase [Bacteroidales bacterium]